MQAAEEDLNQEQQNLEAIKEQVQAHQPTPTKSDIAKEGLKNTPAPAQRKGPSLDTNNQRLERLISDSNKRRSRYQRDALQSSGMQAAALNNNHTQEDIKNDLAGGPDDKRDFENGSEHNQQYSEIAERYSNFASAGRFNKETLFNQTLNLSSQRKSNSRKPTNATVPLHALPKKTAEPKTVEKPTAAQASKLWHQQLRSEKQPPMTPGQTLAQKVVKAKINTNLRSSSSSGQIRGRTKSPTQRAKEQVPKVKLGMSQEDRLKEELSRGLNDKIQMEKVENHVNDKYQEIEAILQANMEAGSPVRGAILNEDISDIEHFNDNSTFGKESVMTDSKPPTVNKKFIGKKVGPFSFATDVRNAQRNASKSSLNSGRPSVKNAAANSTISSQTIHLTDRPAKVSQSKTSSIQRSAGRKPLATEQKADDSQISVPSSTKPTRLGQRNQVNRLSKPAFIAAPKTVQPPVKRPETAAKDKSPMRQAVVKKVKESIDVYQKQGAGSASRQQQPPKPQQNTVVSQAANVSPSRQRYISSSSVGVNNEPPWLNLKQKDSRSGSELTVQDETGKNSSSGVKNSFKNAANMSNSNKTDIMNLDIEQVWKEMEEISRSKKAAHELFQAFQDKYYDQTDPVFFDAEQVSPTKRLISMKNSTTKHHLIEYRKGITGRYAIQYTTCPEKSYVILPDQGETDYDKYKEKHAHQFVEQIINGTVEKVELEERGKRKKSNPNSRVVTNNSPVRINREHCQRAEMIGSFNFNVGTEQQVPVDQVAVDASQQDKPDIEIINEPSNSNQIVDNAEDAQQNEQEDSIHNNESIINICSTGKNSHGESIIVVEEKLDTQIQVQKSQEQQELDSQLVQVPFHSDEQPIKVENNTGSIISATHEMFDHPVHGDEPSREEDEAPVVQIEEQPVEDESTDQVVEELSAAEPSNTIEQPPVAQEELEQVQVSTKAPEDEQEGDREGGAQEEQKEEPTEEKKEGGATKKQTGRRKNKGRKRY